MDASPVIGQIQPVFRCFAICAGSDQNLKAEVVRSNHGVEWQRHGWLLWLCSRMYSISKSRVRTALRVICVHPVRLSKALNIDRRSDFLVSSWTSLNGEVVAPRREVVCKKPINNWSRQGDDVGRCKNCRDFESNQNQIQIKIVVPQQYEVFHGASVMPLIINSPYT